MGSTSVDVLEGAASMEIAGQHLPEEVARGVVPSHQSAPLVLERFYARLNRGITSALPLSASR